MHLRKSMIKKFFTFLISFFLFFNTSIADDDNILKIGNANAKVKIKVFSSLTCPHCAKFHLKIFEKLKKEYLDTGKVIFEHHSFPLDMAALNAEKILRCNLGIEKSFQLLGEIYKKQEEWAVGSDIKKINESIKNIGLNYGINDTEIEKCFKDEKLQDQILNERIEAQKNYKISSTPTIYINDKKYEGKHEFKSFKKVLEKII